MQTISVAMCTYNGERYLREQLDSIAAQAQLPAELVVCDDGSTDATLAILTDFARSAPFRVEIIRNERNLGVTRNFEKAIERCSGELVALADQDDVWHPSKLERLSLPLTRDNSLGAVFCDAYLIDERSNPTGQTLWQAFGFGATEQNIVASGAAARLLSIREVVTGAAMMFRAALREQLLPLDARWIHDAWLAWMVVLHSRLGFVPERLMGYRVHAAQQAGIPRRTWRSRWSNWSASEAQLCDWKAQRFEALASHCRGRGRCSSETLRDIDNVIALCRMRAELPSGLLARARLVLPKIGWYRAYTSGALTAFRDMIRSDRAQDGQRA